MATPSTSTPGTTGTPSALNPPSPPRKRSNLGIAIAAVVIVVVILLALLLSGAIPGFKLGSSGGGGNSGPSYAVNFTETGLPAGTSWSVTMAGSTHSSITNSTSFTEPNGSYSWTVVSAGYKATPASGTIHVAGGPQSQSISFAALPPGVYSVTFSQSGLPSGTSWSVTLNGSAQSSTTAQIVFSTGNGSLPYTVGSVAGYTASPGSGTITVAGAAVSQGVAFSPVGGGGGGNVAFSTALASAKTVVASGATAIIAAGFDVTASYTNTSTPYFGNSSCTFTGGSGTFPTAPAYTGNYHNGLMSAWVFFFYLSSPTPTISLATVVGSSATLIGSVTGSSCVSSYLSYDTGLNSIVDSTVVAANLASVDASYTSTYSTASSVFTAITGYSYAGTIFSYGEWTVTFTTCSPNGGGTGNNFTATLNATNGNVISNSTSSGPCGTVGFRPHGEPGSAVAFGSGADLAAVLRIRPA